MAKTCCGSFGDCGRVSVAIREPSARADGLVRALGGWGKHNRYVCAIAQSILNLSNH